MLWSAHDLAFATPCVARSVTSWHVGTGVGGYTHRPVLFDVGVVRVRRPAAQFRWKVRPASLGRFDEELQAPLMVWEASTCVDDDVDASYRQWRRVLLGAANAVVGRTRVCVRRSCATHILVRLQRE